MGTVAAAQQVQDMGIVSAAAAHNSKYLSMTDTSQHNIPLVLSPTCPTNTRILFGRFLTEYPAYDTLMGMIFV